MKTIKYLFYVLLLGAAVCGCEAVVPTLPAGVSLPAACPNSADAEAIGGNLPLPYPNGAATNPFPAPGFFHPCRDVNGNPTSLVGTPCMVCGDIYDQDDVTATAQHGGGSCTQDTARTPSWTDPTEPFVVCVPSAVFRELNTCDPVAWGCSAQ